MTVHTDLTACLHGRGRPHGVAAPGFVRDWSRNMPNVLQIGGDTPVRFALYREIGGSSLPMVFPSLDRLCRRIHVERDGRGIELQDAPLMLAPGQEAADGVSIWVRDAEGLRGDFLGYAFAEGRDRRQLEAALYAVQPCLVWADGFDSEAA